MMPSATGERPLGELFAKLAGETGTLVRKEVELAKTEMTVKAVTAGKDAAIIAAGGVCAHAGALFVLAGVVLGLGTLIPLWVAALVVGAAAMAVGLALAQRGRAAFKRFDPVPHQTLATLKENTSWAKQELGR